MHLQERFLEHVLGRGSVAEEADEEVIQLTLVAGDEVGEGFRVAVTVVGEQFFVGDDMAGATRAGSTSDCDGTGRRIIYGRARFGVVVSVAVACAVAAAILSRPPRAGTGHGDEPSAVL